MRKATVSYLKELREKIISSFEGLEKKACFEKKP